MNITMAQQHSPASTPYANTLSMVIKSFKGRRDVEVHLFRSIWDDKDEQAQDWDTIIACSSIEAPSSSRNVVMESFSNDERDHIIEYLKRQYSTRLSAIRSTPLTFPVPAGLSGLGQCQADKNIGFIEFTRIPSYSLDIPLKGLYDLSQHLPIVEE